MAEDKPVVPSGGLNISSIEYRPAPVRRRPRLLDQVLTKDEFMALLRAGGPKDKAILCLGILGLRASEIAACRADWIDWGERILTVPPEVAKRGHGRRIYIGFSPVWEVLQAYFLLEPAIYPNATTSGRQAVWYRVKALARKAGLKKPLTPHGLRATGATWAAEAGFSAQALKELFGWESLRTAEFYISSSGRTGIEESKKHQGYI